MIIDGKGQSVPIEKGEEIAWLLTDYKMQGTLFNPYFEDVYKADLDLVCNYDVSTVRRLSFVKKGDRIVAYVTKYSPDGPSKLYGKVLNADELYENILKIINQQ